MSEYALTRAKARKKPRGLPPHEPWWFLAVCAVIVACCFVREVVTDAEIPRLVIEGWFFCFLTDRAVRSWQWEQWRKP